jgi:hypothetical protein
MHTIGSPQLQAAPYSVYDECGTAKVLVSPSTDPLAGGTRSVAPIPSRYIPELSIPTFPFCGVPPTFFSHLGRRLDSYTAYLSVGFVMQKSTELNMKKGNPANAVGGRVWVTIDELMRATGKQRRQVFNGVEEARSKGVLDVKTDSKRGSGWWLTALPGNFTSGPPNPPRKCPVLKSRTAHVEKYAEPLAALRQSSVQPIAEQAREDPSPLLAPVGPKPSTQSIAVQPIAQGYPDNTRILGEDVQPIAQSNTFAR